MAVISAIRAVLGATVQIPDSVFDRCSPFKPNSIGEQLARPIDSYVRDQSLGYYPALDFFQDRGVIDKAQIELLEQLIWLGTSLVRDEVRSRLRPFFASVQVQSMQTTVYSLPQVRPGQSDALRCLAQHLTPNRARFDLLLTLLRRQAAEGNIDTYIERVVHRHLSDTFDTIAIGGINILDQDG